MVRWDWLESLIVVVNCSHSWCFRDSRVLCCHVVYLARFKLARVTTTLSDMSDFCLLQSLSTNSTFIMLYLYHEMDVDYLVVDELVNIKIV
jgi:hypothetical protein